MLTAVKLLQRDIIYKLKVKSSKFRQIDTNVTTEDIMITWNLSQYAPNLSFSFNFG